MPVLLRPLLERLRALLRPEHGDVPGWVLVTAMTVALVVAIWQFAGTAILNIIRDALSNPGLPK